MTDSPSEYPAPIHEYPSATSSNDLARAALNTEPVHGELFICRAQTAGRGRHGRTWFSPAVGNLYMSLVLTPDWASSVVPQLTLAAGVAVHQALQTAGLETRLKWPNDILFEGRKLGGVLCEGVLRDGAVIGVIVGIGLNLRGQVSSFPEALQGHVATFEVASEHSPPKPGQLATSIATRILQVVDRGEQGLREARESWRVVSSLPQQVQTPDGVTGEAFDIDARGALRVRTSAGEVVVDAGEVVWL